MNREIPFQKYHGCGNDFVIISDFDNSIRRSVGKLSELAKSILDRHFGIGGDQLLILSTENGVSARAHIYNPDGSESGMCGNGMRCIAKVLVEEEKVTSNSNITIKLNDRVVSCSLNSDGSVTVDMGEPVFDAKLIPIKRVIPEDGLNVDILGHPFTVFAVSMGNPHCVTFVSNPEEIDLTTIGRTIETHSMFPKKANVSFARADSRSDVTLRVWERGAGATLACGSAACATLVSGTRAGILDRRAQINLPGGSLLVSWDKEDNHVHMTGEAVRVAKGVYEF